MSHVLFLDDSRIEELGISSLGGLLVSHAEYGRLRDQLRALKEAHLGDGDAAIKWSPGRDDELFRAQRTLPDQRPFREAVSSLLGEIDGVLMFACIDEQSVAYRAERRERYLRQGLEYLCQRTELHMRQINGHAQIICDLPGSGLIAPLARHYHHLHRTGTSGSVFGLNLNHLDRTLLYSHTFLCEGLQLADIAIGGLSLCAKGRGEDYLRRFAKKIRRQQPGGPVKGYGIVVYPSNSTVVDAVCAMCSECV